MQTVLLTGASGFVGAAVRQRLLDEGKKLVLAVRQPTAVTEPRMVIKQIAELGADTDWGDCLGAVDAVVHSAARVHVMKEAVADPLGEFRRVNVEGTLALAWRAAQSGVRRFVFISSIKVNGESTLPGQPFKASDKPAPVDPYGISKYEAEVGLQALAAETGMEVVVIRPVLVYGPGVKANFRSMMSWIKKGLPLPLGAIHNKRSLVALDNLVDLIAICLDHPAAANQTFLVSDGEDVSTSELLRRTAQALDRPVRLLPVPAGLLTFGAGALGKGAAAQRLCGWLQVDIQHTCETLDWRPPVSVDGALRKTAQAYLSGR